MYTAYTVLRRESCRAVAKSLHPIFHSVGSTSLGMVQAVEGFVVHHAAASGRLLQEHLNFQCGMVENHLTVKADNKDFETCKRLIELFSHPGEWILDINLPQGVLFYTLQLHPRLTTVSKRF